MRETPEQHARRLEYQARYRNSARGQASRARYVKSSEGLTAIARGRKKHNKANHMRERDAIREMVRAFKSKPCADCKNTFHWACMDFDHRPGEKKSFSVGARKRSRNVVLAEIGKCDVVCSNCHRTRTFLRAHGNLPEAVFAAFDWKVLALYCLEQARVDEGSIRTVISLIGAEALQLGGES